MHDTNIGKASLIERRVDVLLKKDITEMIHRPRENDVSANDQDTYQTCHRLRKHCYES